MRTRLLAQNINLGVGVRTRLLHLWGFSIGKIKDAKVAIYIYILVQKLAT